MAPSASLLERETSPGVEHFGVPPKEVPRFGWSREKGKYTQASALPRQEYGLEKGQSRIPLGIQHRPSPDSRDTHHLHLRICDPKKVKEGFEFVSEWVPPLLYRPQNLKSNWVFLQSNYDAGGGRHVSKVPFTVNYISSAGVETNSVYAEWVCTPLQYISSRAWTVYCKWTELWKKHNVHRLRLNERGCLLSLAISDSLYFINSDELHNRVVGILRRSSRRNQRILYGVHKKLLLEHGSKAKEVYRRRVLEMLGRYHPKTARSSRDKTPLLGSGKIDSSLIERGIDRASPHYLVRLVELEILRERGSRVRPFARIPR